MLCPTVPHQTLLRCLLHIQEGGGESAVIHGKEDGNAFAGKGSNGNKVRTRPGCMHSIGVDCRKMPDAQTACRVSHAESLPAYLF